jgi:hypothetical protein
VSIDLTDPATFDQWVEYFKILLGASSGSHSPVSDADTLAQRAVELVQRRAKERKPR